MNSILVLKVSLLGLFALSVLSCGGNLKNNYPSGAVPCREETTKIVEVINPAIGKKWMYRNLGASKVAEWVDDPEAYGELYQWGRFPDGHQCRRSDQGIRKATSELPNVSNYWHGT